MSEYGPPQDEEELRQRESGWNAFFDKLQNDPAAQSALFAFGQSLVQPRAVGQTSIGQFANSAAIGLQTYQDTQRNLRTQQQENVQAAQQDRELAQGDRRLDIQDRQISVTEDIATRNRDLEAEIAKNQLTIDWYKARTDRQKLEILRNKATSENLEFRSDMMKIAMQQETEAALSEGRAPSMDNTLIIYREMITQAGKEDTLGGTPEFEYDKVFYDKETGLWYGTHKTTGESVVLDPNEIQVRFGSTGPTPEGDAKPKEDNRSLDERLKDEDTAAATQKTEAAARKKKASAIRSINKVLGRHFKPSADPAEARKIRQQIQDNWDSLSEAERAKAVRAVQKIDKRLADPDLDRAAEIGGRPTNLAR